MTPQQRDDLQAIGQSAALIGAAHARLSAELDPPVPTYALTAAPAAVSEGGQVEIVLTTTHVPAGSVLHYTIDGIKASDLVNGALTGDLVLAENGKASLVLRLAADQLTEGAETVTVMVGEASVSVAVADTSLSPDPTPIGPVLPLLPPPQSYPGLPPQVRLPWPVAHPAPGLIQAHGSLYKPASAHPSYVREYVPDFLVIDKIPAQHTPWTVYRDPATLTFAPHLNGVPPAQWVVMAPFGYRQSYAGQLPWIRPTDGKWYGIMPSASESPDQAARSLSAGYTSVRSDYVGPLFLEPGRRGESCNSPYVTWHGHTRKGEDGALHSGAQVPIYIGISAHGMVLSLHPDGELKHLFTVPLSAGSWSNDFSYAPDRKIMYVADSGAGRVLRIDRTPQVPTVSAFVEGLGHVSSLRVVGAELFCVNDQTGVITGVDLASRATRTIAVIQHAYWVDHDSQGRLLVMTRQRQVYRIDPATLEVSGDLVPLAQRTTGLTAWVTIECDRTGSLGVVDAMFLTSVTISATVVFRIAANGTNLGWPGQSGNSASGEIQSVLDQFGHYTWSAVPHPDQAVLLVQGKSEVHPTIICGLAASDPWRPTANRGLYPFGKGRRLLLDGFDQTNPEPASVPTFHSQMNDRGGGVVNFDHITAMPLQEAGRFIKAGMCSYYPRPGMSDAAIRAALIYIHANSQQYLQPLTGGNQHIVAVWAQLRAMTF